MNKYDAISMLFLGLTIAAVLHKDFVFFMVNSCMSRIKIIEKKDRKGDKDA